MVYIRGGIRDATTKKTKGWLNLARLMNPGICLYFHKTYFKGSFSSPEDINVGEPRTLPIFSSARKHSVPLDDELFANYKTIRILPVKYDATHNTNPQRAPRASVM